MKNRRLAALLALLAAVLILRWWDPLSRHSSQGTPVPASAAVDHAATRTLMAPSPAASASSLATTAALPVWPVRPAVPASAIELKHLHNPFAIRTVVLASPVPPPRPTMVVPPTPAFQPPPPPPPEPAPPLQVIGTWNDGRNKGVFIAGPDGTSLVHAGDTLMAQYKIVSLDETQVAVEELSNQHRWQLPVPTTAGSSWQSQ